MTHINLLRNTARTNFLSWGKNTGTLILAGVLIVCSVTVSVNTTFAQENIGQTSQALTTKPGVKYWTDRSNAVPVCWETPGYDREKQISKEAVINSWGYWANITFTGWEACPTGGDAQFVRIRVNPQGPEDAGAGGKARVGEDALSRARDNSPGMQLWFDANVADRGRVEYVAVHEFGHVLGFIHEQDAPGNEGPGRCNSSVGPAGSGVAVTHYDRDSIMNYCNREGNMTGNLTDVDVAGAQQIYGSRRRNVASLNSCQTGPLKLRSSVAAAWNNYGKNSVAVFPSDGSKFLYATQWAVKDGGWGDDVKWASGDFTGDGKSDLVAAWNNGGHTTLTMRSSTGSGFAVSHWLISAGGWMRTSQYLSGDFNGDGKADLAVAWNDGGRTTIGVFLSDGTKFSNPIPWATRDGGWADDVRWFAGDFNGDGKTDLGIAWNNDGITTLSVRLSDGTKFQTAHWLTNGGRWFDRAIYVAGDFNNDGKADVARLWYDLGYTSTTVYLSRGSSFDGPSPWAVRDGGWPEIVKWIPGDVNGDGAADLIAVWSDRGQNTLTARLSNGSNRFSVQQWSNNNGGWLDTTSWCGGKFN
jgi:FG-GAP-like repeat